MCRGDPLAIARFRKVARDPPSSSVESPPIANALNRRTARAWSSQGRSVPDCRPSRGCRSRSRKRHFTFIIDRVRIARDRTIYFASLVTATGPAWACVHPGYLSRVREKRERLRAGARLLLSHRTELYELLCTAFAEEAVSERVDRFEDVIETLRSELKKLDG